MKIKTSELKCAALDWAVANCEGFAPYVLIGRNGEKWCAVNVSPAGSEAYSPSTNWAQGGPIIEREKIELVPSISGKCWHAENLDGKYWIQRCPTPLIAAMRCYVASKLGDEVEVPEELI